MGQLSPLNKSIQALLVILLFLVVRTGATSSFLLLVVMPCKKTVPDMFWRQVIDAAKEGKWVVY